MPSPLLRLQPISNSHYYTSGDVIIQAGVAIAPGVLIQADPNSRVLIKTGACIGIGAILHAHHGTLEVGEGANIGAEVLLVGHLAIGAHACIGAATTIFNTSVAGQQIIPPGSLIGEFIPPTSPELHATDTVLYPSAEAVNGVSPCVTEPVSPPDSQDLATSPTEAPAINVYGQVYVNQMLVKMFPHRQQSQPDSTPANGALPSDDPWANDA
jgi:carbon dioxide concentrating mechanism protein CcmN